MNAIALSKIFLTFLGGLLGQDATRSRVAIADFARGDAEAFPLAGTPWSVLLVGEYAFMVWPEGRIIYVAKPIAEAFAWAERYRLEVNAATGAIELIPTEGLAASARKVLGWG